MLLAEQGVHFLEGGLHLALFVLLLFVFVGAVVAIVVGVLVTAADHVLEKQPRQRVCTVAGVISISIWCAVAVASVFLAILLLRRLRPCSVVVASLSHLAARR